MGEFDVPWRFLLSPQHFQSYADLALFATCRHGVHEGRAPAVSQSQSAGCLTGTASLTTFTPPAARQPPGRSRPRSLLRIPRSSFPLWLPPRIAEVRHCTLPPARQRLVFFHIPS